MFFSIYTSMLRFCLLPQLRGCALSLSICIRRILYIYIILRPSLSFLLHLGWICEVMVILFTLRPCLLLTGDVGTVL